MALNVSLCFAGLATDLYNVTMSTTTDPKEPEVRWDPLYSQDGAEPGQVFMGTTGSHLSAAERGILSISDFRHTDGLKAEDILPQFDVSADIDVTFSTQLRIPRHWGGLISALVMVILNLICVWAITVFNRVTDEKVEKQLKADDYLVFTGRPKGSENVPVLRC
ncbi:hypothetical protein INS49_015657 [Diaporthe citri]|uniref:uncharacterized protein n=1 Tax=Diaporthe citri TaxID=83186 RepID=UPI001C7F004F|nr:uncharacterized protein INS49_015657 [Diaporthe citri]KAG6356270.1 hypothetical protein INS49_015657 [Diaporthe citri]